MIRVVLKDIVERPITGEWGNEGSLVKVLRTTNFTNEGFIDYTKVVKRDIEQKKINTKRLVKGDLIIEKSGGSPTQPVGRVVYFDSDGIFLCNNFTAILRPKKEQVFPKYLHYLLFVGHQFGLTSSFQNKTTGIINLQLTKYLEGIQIPLPPLPQQKKIANILDAADSLRQNDKALLVKYDKLIQALFLSMFGDPVSNPKGWEMKPLNELVSKLGDGLHGTPKYSEDGEYYFVNGNNLDNGKITISENTKRVDFSEYEKHKKDLNENSILVSINGTIGKIAFYNKEKIILGKSACYFNLIKGAINELFLFHIFKSDYFLRYSSSLSTGSTIQNVSLKTMREFPIPNPPIDLQNQFAKWVKLIEEQKAIAQKCSEKSEELFNSLLQKAFKGELV